MFNFVLREQSIPMFDLFSWYLFALLSLFYGMHRIAVKQVILELRPRLSEEKLLVSIAVTTKMQDLQVNVLKDDRDLLTTHELILTYE
jgi:hypothetical protein